MSSTGASSSVRAWPRDPRARAYLSDFLDRESKGDPEAVLGADEADFRGLEVVGLNLARAFLIGANFRGTRLIEVNLYKANLVDVDFTDADLTGSRLRRIEGSYLHAVNAELTNVDAFDAELFDADMRGCRLRGAHLSRAGLDDADLRDADLSGCRLGTDDTPAFLHAARLHGAQVTGAYGAVVGPANVGDDEESLVDREDLELWFRDNGARDVRTVVPPGLREK